LFSTATLHCDAGKNVSSSFYIVSFQLFATSSDVARVPRRSARSFINAKNTGTTAADLKEQEQEADQTEKEVEQEVSSDSGAAQ
jgi:hypothetical protein